MDDNVYTAERILAKRKVKGVTLYRISWKGYGPSDNTWEPVDNIIDKALIRDFENKKLKTRKSAMENKRRSSSRNSMPSKRPVGRPPNRPDAACIEKPTIGQQQQQEPIATTAWQEDKPQHIQQQASIASPVSSRATPQPPAATENSKPVTSSSTTTEPMVNGKPNGFDTTKTIADIAAIRSVVVAEQAINHKQSMSVSPQPSVATSRSSFASPVPSLSKPQTPAPEINVKPVLEPANHMQVIEQPSPKQSPGVNLPQQPQAQLQQHQPKQSKLKLPRQQTPSLAPNAQQQQQPTIAANRPLKHNPVANHSTASNNVVSQVRRGASRFAIMNTIVTDVTINDQTITISESRTPQCFFREVERNSIAIDATTHFADNNQQTNGATD